MITLFKIKLSALLCVKAVFLDIHVCIIIKSKLKKTVLSRYINMFFMLHFSIGSASVTFMYKFQFNLCAADLFVPFEAGIANAINSFK